MINGKLHDLISVLKAKPLHDAGSVPEFTGLTIDSRTAEQSNLFIAIKGEINDGHKYLQDADKKRKITESF